MPRASSLITGEPWIRISNVQKSKLGCPQPRDCGNGANSMNSLELFLPGVHSWALCLSGPHRPGEEHFWPWADFLWRSSMFLSPRQEKAPGEDRGSICPILQQPCGQSYCFCSCFGSAMSWHQISKGFQVLLEKALSFFSTGCFGQSCLSFGQALLEMDFLEASSWGWP